MNALKTTGEWPHHQDKHGNWVPCASNPCKTHGGTEIMARNPEEAFEKANSAFIAFGMQSKHPIINSRQNWTETDKAYHDEIIEKLNNAGIKQADNAQNDEDIIKELRDNDEYIDDNPRCFHVNDDVSAYDIAHALFSDADHGDNDDIMEALNERSQAIWNKLSYDEMIALNDYCDRGYQQVNGTLIKGQDVLEDDDGQIMTSEQVHDEINNISSALSKTGNVITHETIVYRSQGNAWKYGIGDETMAIMSSLASNDGVPVVRRPNYVSTSMQASSDTADFNSSAHHETQYVISVPAGVRALSVANHSEFSENELIIDKGYKFEVIGVFQTSQLGYQDAVIGINEDGDKQHGEILNWKRDGNPIIALRVIPDFNVDK